eukprot:scaffold54038_cov40-Phaeocystis_antarctica.AAC.3
MCRLGPACLLDDPDGLSVVLAARFSIYLVEVEAPAAGLLPKDRPKLSPEKRKVGSAEPASPSKRALVAV